MTVNKSPDRDLATLFVELTGETTVVERQDEDAHGVLDGDEGAAVAETMRNNGLDDALAEPDVD
ncbi:hypothetical protein [Haloarchaeobius sp. HME9146]|uniref:hypothetical protein n=1 Tax=Haloarchaeobius sp. HME9146 TaxID=2978732 RepID=UPI0021BFADF8|nr:hypothetical protein [Haloarchaeobius sp. HME9146]MCT9098304.1 hypothetical protein [Haloarchaeobius sp. HME9146]